MARRRRNKRKYLYWLVVLVFFVAAGVVVYLVWDNYFKDKSKDGQGDENVEVIDIANDSDARKSTDNEEAANAVAEKVVEEKKVVSYEGDDPNSSDKLTGIVTYVGVNDAVLMIRVNIDQYLDGGTCELSLEGNTSYSDIVNIVGGASTATCEGFDVPVNMLASGGYRIIIKIKSGDRTGTINGEVSI